MEDEILYLSVHLTYSHNFQRLFWLLDIQKLLEKHEQEIDWEKLRKRARLLKAEKAVAAAFIGLEKAFGYELLAWPFDKKYSLLRFFITQSFLYKPYESMPYYLLMKHILQDSLWNALKYDLHRLRLEIRRKLGRVLAAK